MGKEKLNDIKTTEITMVTSKCPLGIYNIGGYLEENIKFKMCSECDFFLENNRCGYELYETRLIDHRSETEEDDSYALPDTYYTWDFKCSKCGHTIHFGSGFSVMVSGNQERCSKCNTKHRYIENSNGIYFFAVPIVHKSNKS